MDVTISSLAQRPDLLDAFNRLENTWPEFIRQDPIGNLYYRQEVLLQFAEYVLIAHTSANEILGKAHSIPLSLDGDQLPADGWDGAIRHGIQTKLIGARPNLLAALEIFVRPDQQGRGLSATILTALKEHAKDLGFAEVVVPVRPNGKTDAHEPMDVYAFRTRDDGLPVDPWLRTHVRAGGCIDGVAPRSMVIPGTLNEWRAWTGMSLEETGPVVVPHALAPVPCDTEHGTAVYIEPNVWVRHRTGM